MSGDGLNTPGYIIPSVRYRDAPAAIEWLCRAFGFTPLLVVPGEDGAIAHAELTLGKGMIMLGSADANGAEEETGPPPENGPATHSVYVVVEHVDTHYERARDAGPTSFTSLRTSTTGDVCMGRGTRKVTCGISGRMTPGQSTPATVDTTGEQS